MKKILIYGAGAIGRGFLAPLLTRYKFQIDFVDNNPKLYGLLKNKMSYQAAITNNDSYDFVEVPLHNIYQSAEQVNIKEYEIVFLCVGPKNCLDVATKIKEAKTIICCENDANLVPKIKELTSNEHVYFGIPDVITSNTAPKELLEQDPLTTVTEQGILVLEKGNYSLNREIQQLNPDELREHWICKLFIHNAPHAILAYLGWLENCMYIHQGMQINSIEKIVEGAIREITSALIAVNMVDKKFANYYADKELARFRNKLLFDPISRVAREPIRKLDKKNRLILSLRVCTFAKIEPMNIAKGIKATLNYNDKLDPEAHYLQTLRQSIGDPKVLSEIGGIDLFDPLNNYILQVDLSNFGIK